VRCEDFTGLASVKSMDRTNQGFSGCRTPDGRIWFPNPRGVVMIDPENFFVNPVPPPVRIQQIRVNGAGRNERQSAILKAGDGRVEFLFAALSFISPKSVQVRYQLEGFDPTWVDAGPRRSVLYNNLKPGRYTFRVQASNADGVWNTTGESFGLELPPSFYQTTWFYVLCGVAGVLILLVAYRWKVRRMELSQRKLQAENNLLESKVAQRTDELAHSLSVLKATIDSTADGILAIDFSDALVCHNTQFAAMWGIPPEVLAQGGNGRVIAFSATQVREPEKYLARIAELKASPVAESFDVIEMKDGRIFERYCRPQRMDGRSVGVVINFRDVTERKRAAAGLEEASGLLDAMLENIPDFIYFKDRASRFVRFSRSFLNRFKLADAAALRGRTDFDLFTAEHAQPAYDDEQAIIRTGNALVGQLEKETYSDGTATWVLTTKMPWRDGHGTVVGTFGISKDVTELKVTEAKLAYERDLLHILFRDLPDSIYFKDLQSRFVRLSQSKVEKALAFLRAAHRARHPAEAADQWPPHLAGVEQLAAWLHGKTDFDLMPEKLARVCYDEEQEIIRTGRPVLRRIENTTLPDGTTAWQVITKMPWRDATGKIIGTYGTAHDITAIKEAEAKLADTHRRLLEISREAGMAEVATGVLHNVGNVLNSVNVSTTLLFDHVRQSKIGGLAKLGELLRAHESDLPGFFGRDPRGRQVPGYLDTLSTHLAAEQAEMLKELASLRNNIEHIKDIVSMQQNYAKVRGVMESVAVTALVEDALHMNASALARHDVTLVRDYLADPVITVEKHKVLQILVNLMRNAKYACDDSGRSDKQMTVRVSADDGRVQIAVIDNGIGIPPENMARIFSHGFTTRQLGHGFGLHTGALAARELGGSLTVQSDGPGRGATFILEIPEQPDAKAA